MVDTFSWGDLGYRKLNQRVIEQSDAGVLDRTKSMSSYELKDNIWFRHRRRKVETKKKWIHLAPEITSKNLSDPDVFKFVDRFFDWLETLEKEGVFEYIYTAENHSFLIELIEERSGSFESSPWGLFEAFSKSLSFTHEKEKYRAILQSVILPKYFSLFPKGRFLVMRQTEESYDQLSVLRILYSCSQFSLEEMKSAGISDFGTMKKWHSADTSGLFASVLRACQYLWFPFVSGVVVNQFGLVNLFLFDTAKEYQPSKFPENWLTFLDFDSSFAAETQDVHDALVNYGGESYQRLSYARPQNTGIPTQEERMAFYEWLIDTLEKWIFNLSDMANFCPNPSEPYESDPVFAFEHLLSIERVVRRLVCLAKSRDMGVAKTAAFEVCDILSSLKNRFKNGSTSQEAELFKEFWNPKLGAEMISESLKRIPGVGDSLAKMSNDCYDELRKVVIESVWYKQKVTNTGVLVRKKNLIDEVEESQDVFVANVMRALRNGHHGYFTEGEKQKRPSRYLSLVTGETPDSMIQLPMLWFLAYLSEPKILCWEPLPIGGYDC